MKRFEVVFFVDAPTLREAKRAARETVKYGTTPAEFVEDLIEGLREVKPPEGKPMSAPRANAAIEAEALRKLRNDNPYDFNAQNFSFKAYDNGLFAAWEVAAALRKEPPALPAEVEAVLMQMKIASGRLYGKTVDVIEDAATLLRRYAQAVAEKDGAKCPCDVHACLATVAEKDAEIARLTSEIHGHVSAAELADSAGVTAFRDAMAAASPCCAEKREAKKKLQAVEALCANARRRDRVIYPGEILDILEWT